MRSTRGLHELARRSWWWVFGLFIAMPAVALAVLGVGALRADDLERQNHRREQEAQLVRLVDTELAAVLDRLAAEGTPANGASVPANDGAAQAAEILRFQVGPDGHLIFPADRVIVGPHDMRVPEAVDLPRVAAALVAEAQAADAQGRTSEALVAYERLRAYQAFRPWVDLQTTLVRSASLDEIAASRILRLGLTRSDARSPSGLPLAIVAASATDSFSREGRRALVPFLAETRSSLQAGRWWLTLAQRRVYNEELERWLTESGHAGGGQTDARLGVIDRVAPLIADALADEAHVPSRAEVLGSGASRVLIVWTRAAQRGATSGVAVPGDRAEATIAATLGPLVSDVAFRLTLTDRRWRIWGTEVGEDAATHPLNSVAGWSVGVTSTSPPPSFERRFLEYGRVLLPIVVLAVGLLMTAWIVRREMALTELQSAFVASVTHEFKSPITSIRLLLERITGGRMAPGHQPERYFEAIGAEADRLEGLVNRLLEAQKLQIGQRQYRFRQTAVDALVREAVGRLRPQADAKRMTLDVELAPALPALELDAESMGDAIGNLIDNAIKYSPEGSSVRVTAGARAGRVRIEVADAGIGVQAADADRIFEPFFRSRRGDQANVHGTGLGLSLVKATAEAHGGTVAVDSDGVRGSRFAIDLPAVLPGAASGDGAQTMPGMPIGRRE